MLPWMSAPLFLDVPIHDVIHGSQAGDDSAYIIDTPQGIVIWDRMPEVRHAWRGVERL
jgi:hypothetical protein